MPGYVDDQALPGGKDRWLLSYADLLTLLLAFFVVMYSVSAVNEAKLAKLSASIASSFNQEVSQTEAVVALPFQVVSEAQGQTTLSLPGELLFDVGSAEIKASANQVLLNLATVLERSEGAIVIEGHTDSLPVRGKYPSNWELSASRAAAAVRFLIQHNVDKQRLVAVGLADTAPIGENETEEGRAKNRRVVFKIEDLDWAAANLALLDQGAEPLLETNEVPPLNEPTISIDDIDPQLLEQVLLELEAERQ